MLNAVSLLLGRKALLPKTATSTGKSSKIARQVDVTLMKSGWKLSAEAFSYIANLSTEDAINVAYETMAALKEALGGHVQHNTYFLHFPKNVPETEAFWLECLFKEVLDGKNPYGEHLHTYEEMLAEHSKFNYKAKVRLVRLGLDPKTELQTVYSELAGSTSPLKPTDLALLEQLFNEGYATDAVPGTRETKALINTLCLKHGGNITIDTVTDVLRIMSLLSGGPADLQTKVKFISPKRIQRRTLVNAINELLSKDPEKAQDAFAKKEVYKRMFERLHVGDYPQYTETLKLSQFVRGELKLPVFSAELHQELETATGDLTKLIALLSKRPGFLCRYVDLILRKGDSNSQTQLLATLKKVGSKVSFRVLLSLYQHLETRTKEQTARIVLPKTGSFKVLPSLPSFTVSQVAPTLKLLKELLVSRIPSPKKTDLPFLVDPEALRVALPLSEKNVAAGFQVLPKGSTLPVVLTNDSANPLNTVLRFFIYWQEAKERTDLDLSCVFLKSDFTAHQQVSYTRLSGADGSISHSGDFTSAPSGASEFIDITLAKLDPDITYIVPQINVYAGEAFNDCAEAFFGYMVRPSTAKGAPFEPKSVVYKSYLTGKGKISYPFVFKRTSPTTFEAISVDLYTAGNSSHNNVESSSSTTSLLLKGIVQRPTLDLNFLLDLYKAKGWTVDLVTPTTTFVKKPVHYVGLSASILHNDSKLTTPVTFTSLLPA